MLKTSALIVLLAIMGGGLAQDYCALCSDHTMCQYKSPGPKCERLIQSGVSASQQAEIVDSHNEYRRRVAAGQETLGSRGGQPGAANMLKMVWDPELAKVAQRWADQCNFAHDSCRTVPRFSVGQNAYTSNTSGSGGSADWRAAVKSWYGEVKDFDKNNILPFKSVGSPVTGHYTQVVWAESKYIGCGYSQFPSGTWTKSIYICNYGPAGNRMGTPMYKLGNACSQCPQGTSCQNSLCAESGTSGTPSTSSTTSTTPKSTTTPSTNPNTPRKPRPCLFSRLH